MLISHLNLLSGADPGIFLSSSRFLYLSHSLALKRQHCFDKYQRAAGNSKAKKTLFKGLSSGQGQIEEEGPGQS